MFLFVHKCFEWQVISVKIYIQPSITSDQTSNINQRGHSQDELMTAMQKSKENKHSRLTFSDIVLDVVLIKVYNSPEVKTC